ncbi:MAG: ECF RNA polymerase sigma factor SigK [Nitriliruptoraceae bacterium]
MSTEGRWLQAVADTAASTAPRVQDEEALLAAVARGDQAAFAALYDRIAPLVHGVVRRVVRDPAQSEEVTQEVLVELWRTAVRFDPDRGTARAWILTMAHRRAIDRVRSEQSSRDRTARVAGREHTRPFDDVAEQVETSLEHDRVRTALATLTDLQRQAVELAYYQGYTYREVAELLDTPLGTIKTRMRDGLIRLRDAMGVA